VNKFAHIRSSLLGLFGFAITIAQTVLQIGFLVRLWPEIEFSAWVQLNAIWAVATAFEAGHQAYVGNAFIAKFRDESDHALRIVNSAFGASAFISILQLAVSLIAVTVFTLGFPAGSASTGKALASVSIMSAAWALYNSRHAIFHRAYIANEELERFILVGIVVRFCQSLSWVVAALLGYGVILGAVLFSIVTMIAFSWTSKDLFFRIPGLRQCASLRNWRSGMIAYADSIVVSVSSFLDALCWVAIISVHSSVGGSGVLPELGTVRTAVNAIQQIAGQVVAPLQRRFATSRSGEEIHKSVAILVLCVAVAVFGGITMQIFLPKVFSFVLELWVGSRVHFTDGIIGLFLAAGVLRMVSVPLLAWVSFRNEIGCLFGVNLCRFIAGLSAVILAAWLNSNVSAAIGMIAAEACALIVFAVLLSVPQRRQLVHLRVVVCGASVVVLMAFWAQCFLISIAVYAVLPLLGYFIVKMYAQLVATDKSGSESVKG
jgi:hypothetical protein